MFQWFLNSLLFIYHFNRYTVNRFSNKFYKINFIFNTMTVEFDLKCCLERWTLSVFFVLVEIIIPTLQSMRYINHFFQKDGAQQKWEIFWILNLQIVGLGVQDRLNGLPVAPTLQFWISSFGHTLETVYIRLCFWKFV